MNTCEYRIGDMAQLVGLSRDTLRFYEKKGILTAQKKDNGYRYYSDKDVYKMMSVVYQRKMNYSLEDIESMMSQGCSNSFLRDHINQRIQEEMEEIRRHQRIITRLNLTKGDLDAIDENINCICLKRFPKAYLMGTAPTLIDGIKEWFRLAAQTKGLDMTYFYSRFQWENDQLSPKDTQLLFYKKAENCLDDSIDRYQLPVTRDAECIYTVISSDQPYPDQKMVLKMREWGYEQGLKPGSILYSNNILSFYKEDQVLCHMELYLPLEN